MTGGRFSFLTVADWSLQNIKKGGEPKQLIQTAILQNEILDKCGVDCFITFYERHKDSEVHSEMKYSTIKRRRNRTSFLSSML